ncbi:hypothetical protein MAPG_06210 [Magnaporthiopsis poae ATCC 64411]|uniref:Secreted protein n=1 Tax=Magnaporthiopsis poae (strain ATCC 64411 / 73-15) TaxID=644358 RepID=A0A0C4E1F0_MAGP6|nr:hypothetical protein MAPG_06210 [Magnaporthiopsis poae ATCC 64411]
MPFAAASQQMHGGGCWWPRAMRAVVVLLLLVLRPTQLPHIHPRRPIHVQRMDGARGGYIRKRRKKMGGLFGRSPAHNCAAAGWCVVGLGGSVLLLPRAYKSATWDGRQQGWSSNYRFATRRINFITSYL